MGIEIQINREQLSKKKLMLGCPMYGGMATGMFTRSTIDLAVKLQQWGVELRLYFLFNESLITRARNYIADEFMRSDCTHLLFVDADIGYNGDDVLAMLALSSDESEYDVLCGPYPKKTISWEKIKVAVERGFADKDPENLGNFVGDFVFNGLPGGNGSIRLDQPEQVLESGTGFMLIQRRAFNMLAKARPDLSYRPDHVRTAEFDGSREIMAFFMDPIDRWNREKLFRETLEDMWLKDMDKEAMRDLISKTLNHEEPESKRLLSEDYFFCQELRKAGGKVWLCPWIKLQHVGTYIFSGSLMDLAQLGASATADPELLQKNRAAAKREERLKR